MTRSEVQKLMADKIKATLEVAMRRVLTGIVDETIEDAFTVEI